MIEFVLVCLVLLLMYSIYVLYKKLSIYEKWFDEIIKRLFEADLKLKEIDSTGSFESDDEVGYFFKSLKEIFTYLNEINYLTNDEVESLEKNEREHEKNKISKNYTKEDGSAKISK